jgi:hypothetical protein
VSPDVAAAAVARGEEAFLLREDPSALWSRGPAAHVCQGLGKGTYDTTYKVAIESAKVTVIKGIDHPNVVPLRAYYFISEITHLPFLN